jgi:alpha-N-acetylgalactosaminidase
MAGHIEQDIKSNELISNMNCKKKIVLAFVNWKVDFLKLDGCYADCTQFDTTYPAVEKALNATGVPIGFHCDWPVYQEDHGIKPNYSAVAYTCNLWRSGRDVQDSWDSVYGIIQWFADNQDRFSPFHGPGQWFDLDMV